MLINSMIRPFMSARDNSGSDAGRRNTRHGARAVTRRARRAFGLLVGVGSLEAARDRALETSLVPDAGGVDLAAELLRHDIDHDVVTKQGGEPNPGEFQ